MHRALPGAVDPLPRAPHGRPTSSRGFAFPTRIDLSSFKAAWTDGHFATGYKSSFIVAATVTVVSAVLSIGTGYAFGTMRFVGDRIVFPIILLGIIFPYEATVIPLYYDFQNVPLLHWNLLNTYWALILPQIGQSVAFGTFWMRAFFRSMPRSLIEAARIDGATSFGVLWRVLLPQAMPAVLTMSVLVFDVHVERVPARARARLRQRVAPDGAARPQLLRRRGARGRPDEGGRGRGARRAADPARVPVPATAFRPRNARRGDQGVR